MAISAAVLPSQGNSQQAMPMNTTVPATDKSYYATKLICPTMNSEKLMFWMSNPAGYTAKLTIKQSNGRPVHGVLEIFKQGQPAKLVVDKPVNATLTKESAPQ